jgi:hypothetical protein
LAGVSGVCDLPALREVREGHPNARGFDAREQSLHDFVLEKHHDMRSRIMRVWRHGLAAVALLTLFSVAARAGSYVWGATEGVAIGGYDPVAYFAEGKPRVGKPELTANWAGAKWQFATAKNRDLFVEAPEKYAPQFGGYCAYAMSSGKLADGDGERWRIVEGKLYLNNNWFAQQLWETNIPRNVQDADEHWPKVKARLESGS